MGVGRLGQWLYVIASPKEGTAANGSSGPIYPPPSDTKQPSIIEFSWNRRLNVTTFRLIHGQCFVLLETKGVEKSLRREGDIVLVEGFAEVSRIVDSAAYFLMRTKLENLEFSRDPDELLEWIEELYANEANSRDDYIYDPSTLLGAARILYLELTADAVRS